MLYDLEKVIEHSLRLYKKMMTGPIVNNTTITIREKKRGEDTRVGEVESVYNNSRLKSIITSPSMGLHFGALLPTTTFSPDSIMFVMKGE